MVINILLKVLDSSMSDMQLLHVFQTRVLTHEYTLEEFPDAVLDHERWSLEVIGNSPLECKADALIRICGWIDDLEGGGQLPFDRSYLYARFHERDRCGNLLGAIEVARS